MLDRRLVLFIALSLLFIVWCVNKSSFQEHLGLSLEEEVDNLPSGRHGKSLRECVNKSSFRETSDRDHTKEKLEHTPSGRQFKSLHEFLSDHLDEEMKIWLDEQEVRRQTLQSGCQALRESGYHGYHPDEVVSARHAHTIVDEKYEVVYCGIHKVASTTMTEILGRLGGIEVTLDMGTLARGNFSLRPLTSYPPGQQRDILGRYTTFLLVRHPLDRLLSAFTDKFVGRGKHQLKLQYKYGRDIARLYRNISDPNNQGLKFGFGVSFPEFLTYLTDNRVPEFVKENIHWDHYICECPVCEDFTPDFILRYEDFSNDVSHLITLLYNKNGGDFINIHKNQSKRKKSKSFQEVFKDLDIDLYNNIIERYKFDMEIFGYDTSR